MDCDTPQQKRPIPSPIFLDLAQIQETRECRHPAFQHLHRHWTPAKNSQRPHSSLDWQCVEPSDQDDPVHSPEGRVKFRDSMAI